MDAPKTGSLHEEGSAAEDDARKEKGKKTERFFEKRRSHSEIKHALLRYYLEAALPITSFSLVVSEILYIDGFAGAGRYETGEPGSPVAFLDLVNEHRFKGKFKHIFALFNELDPDNRRKLEDSIAAECEAAQLHNVTIRVYGDEFERSNSSPYTRIVMIPKVLQDFKAWERNKYVFAFVDPFGLKVMPMEVVKQIVDCPRGEVLVTFWSSFANRFKGEASYGDTLDIAFGGKEWRQLIGQQGTREALLNLYMAQLPTDKKLRFGVCTAHNGAGGPTFHMVFASNHKKGMMVMKDAMWAHSVLRDGDDYGLYWVGNRSTDKKANEWYPRLTQKVLEQFADQEVKWNTVAEYVLYQTIFPVRNGSLLNRKHPFKEMLKEGLIKWVEPCTRAGAIPNNSKLMFASDRTPWFKKELIHKEDWIALLCQRFQGKELPSQGAIKAFLKVGASPAWVGSSSAVV
ncbi:Three-Cys-motif partner protein TcmP [Balamuthia mandrillaris]